MLGCDRIWGETGVWIVSGAAALIEKALTLGGGQTPWGEGEVLPAKQYR